MPTTTINRRSNDAHDGLARLVVCFVGGIAVLSLVTGASLAIYFGNRGEANFAAMVGLITVIFGIPNACVMGLLGLLGYSPSRNQPTGTPADPVNIATPPGQPAEVTTDVDGALAGEGEVAGGNS